MKFLKSHELMKKVLGRLVKHKQTEALNERKKRFEER